MCVSFLWSWFGWSETLEDVFFGWFVVIYLDEYFNWYFVKAQESSKVRGLKKDGDYVDKIWEEKKWKEQRSFDALHLWGIKQCKRMLILNNFEGFPLQKSIVWVGNIMTPEESVEVFKHWPQTAHVAHERAVAAEVFLLCSFQLLHPRKLLA